MLDISHHLDHRKVLAAAGITAAGVLPETVECPFCRKPTMTVWMDVCDPTAAGKWLQCRTCGFHGDTLETAAGIYRVGRDLRRAAEFAVAADMVVGIESNEFLGECQSYVTAVPGSRWELEAIFQQLQANLSVRPHPDVLVLAEREKIWGGWSSVFQARIGRFLGGFDRRTLKSLGWKKYVPPGISGIVIPLQDVPGRIRGFRVLGSDGGTYTVRSAREESGLSMLDCLGPHESIVYAVGDIRIAIQMHVHHFINRDEPLRLVAFDERTNASWNSISADKVVLWSPVIDGKFLQHLPRVRNAWVASAPGWTAVTDVSRRLNEESSSGLLARMAKSAKPWKEFLIEWATSPDRQESFVRAQLAAMNMDRRAKEDLLESCPAGRRLKLEGLLGESQVVRTAVVAGGMVLERDGEWVVPRKAGPETITDSIIRIERELSDVRSGRIWWEGVVVRRNQQVEFTVEAREMEQDPAGWLRTVTAKAGLGAPVLAKAWETRLAVLAKLFSTPAVVPIDTRPGMKPNLDVVFPDFRIEGGRCLAGRFGFPEGRAPGDPDLSRLFLPDATAQVWAAVLGLWLHGLFEEACGRPFRPFAVIGPPGSAGLDVFRAFRDQLGMLNHVAKGLPPAEHEWTTAIEGDLHALPLGWRGRAMFCGSAAVCRALETSGWSVVDGRGLFERPPPDLRVVAAVVAAIQRNHRDVHSPALAVASVCRSLQDVLAAPPELAEQALRRGSRAQPHEAAMLAWLAIIESGGVGVAVSDFAELPARRDLVTVGQERVFLPMQALKGLPKLDLHAVAVSGRQTVLRLEEYGMVVRRRDWDRMVL